MNNRYHLNPQSVVVGSNKGKSFISKPNTVRPPANIKEYVLAARYVQEGRPEFWRLVCPRRYIPPQGYANPKVHSLSMASHLICNKPDADLNKVLIDCLLTDWKLVELGVPTFFVGADFLSDLMITKAPEAMLLKDILWPEDAMVFMLPDSFQRQFFGHHVPFITICKTKTGRQEPPAQIDKVCDQHMGLGIGYAGAHGVIATASVFFNSEYGIDYSASYSGEDLISKVYQDHDFHDNTQSWIKDGLKQGGIEVTKEQDVEICQKIMSCALQLVLAMGEIPEYLAPGPTVARPESKHRNGTVHKEQLWHPRMFGGNYVSDKRPVSSGGTHASPHIHRRKGHWRREVGWRELPADVRPKTIWIKPMWVGK